MWRIARRSKEADLLHEVILRFRPREITPEMPLNDHVSRRLANENGVRLCTSRENSYGTVCPRSSTRALSLNYSKFNRTDGTFS
jgi:hypothetical protein